MNHTTYEPKGATHIHTGMHIPFEVFILNDGYKAKLLRNQALAQYKHPSKPMLEIDCNGKMNKAMQKAYATFLKCYFKHGENMVLGLRMQANFIRMKQCHTRTAA